MGFVVDQTNSSSTPPVHPAPEPSMCAGSRIVGTPVTRTAVDEPDCGAVTDLWINLASLATNDWAAPNSTSRTKRSVLRPIRTSNARDITSGSSSAKRARSAETLASSQLRYEVRLFDEDSRMARGANYDGAEGFSPLDVDCQHIGSLGSGVCR